MRPSDAAAAMLRAAYGNGPVSPWNLLAERNMKKVLMADALKTMAQQQVHRLLVVEKSGALKGILSMNDVILQAKPETDGVLRDEVIQTLKALCEHREPLQSKQAGA
jgi:hypothetical protein